MPKFRKKPIVVDAIQVPDLDDISDQDKAELQAFLDASEHPYGRTSEILLSSGVLLATLEGAIKAVPGDWIIRGIEGELYPCKPEIFAKTYERVREDGDHDVGKPVV